MDAKMQSLIRQYSANPGDVDLAQQIANTLLRSGAKEEANKDFVGKIRAYQDVVGVLRKELCADVKDEIQRTMASYPQIIGIRWTQYTPYFNDGNECIFGVGEVRVRLAGTPEDGGDYEDGYLDSYNLGEYSRERHEYVYETEEAKQAAAIINEVGDFIAKIPDDVMKDSFGDHVQITVTHADGFIIEEYVHD